MIEQEVVLATEKLRRFLDDPEPSLEVLRIHQFEDDDAAHNDELQERLEKDFTSDFRQLVVEFNRLLGEPTRTDCDDIQIPVDGVLHSAEWIVKNRVVFVGTAHEDRETAFLLVCGVT